jgi:hypothetical protein
MSGPNLTNASFAKLHHGQGKKSNGTVSGTAIAAGFSVHIISNKGRIWDGAVTASAGGNKWNATVTPTSASQAQAQEGPGTRDLDTITVTVTNNSGQTSNPVVTGTDDVP